jgi:hypothetical protein
MRVLRSIVAILVRAVANSWYDLTAGGCMRPSLSVISRSGRQPCSLICRGSKRLATLVLRRPCRILSRIYPPWSIVRQSPCFLPAMQMTTSSRCQMSVGRCGLPRRRRIGFDPNFLSRKPIVSQDILVPHLSRNSSISWRLRGSWKYNQPASTMIWGEN